MDNTMRMNRLAVPSKEKVLNVVIDSDTFNEVDDLYAIAYALLSQERLNVAALYASPFLNFRCKDIEDAMNLSYNEMKNLLEKMEDKWQGSVCKGATDTITNLGKPVESEATADLINRAMATGEDPLYVVSIGPLTNVASAIMLKPEIIDKIVVVWLGYGTHVKEWKQEACPNTTVDTQAARCVFNCGVPLIHFPELPVTSTLLTSIHDLEHYLAGKNRLCDFLLDRFRLWQKSWAREEYGWAKSLWDVATIAYLVNPDTARTQIVDTPEIPFNFGVVQNTGDDYVKPEWAHVDERCPIAKKDLPDCMPKAGDRHKCRIALELNRNMIYYDLYKKLSGDGRK